MRKLAAPSKISRPSLLPFSSPLGDADGKRYQRDIKESRCEHDEKEKGRRKRMRSEQWGLDGNEVGRECSRVNAPFTPMMNEQLGSHWMRNLETLPDI